MAVQTNRDSDKVIIRLPDGMRDRIKAAADANGRSMNSEIVATLEDKYPVPVASMSISDLEAIVAYVAAAPTGEEFYPRIDEANEQLAGTGAQLVFTPDNTGRSNLLLRLGTADSDRIHAVLNEYVERKMREQFGVPDEEPDDDRHKKTR